MAKQASQEEQDEARHELELAIYHDGKGKAVGGQNFYDRHGYYIWEPKPETFSHWWTKGAFTYVMTSTEQQVKAYHRQGETVVTHNGQERARLGARGWY